MYGSGLVELDISPKTFIVCMYVCVTTTVLQLISSHTVLITASTVFKYLYSRGYYEAMNDFLYFLVNSREHYVLTQHGIRSNLL